MTGTVRSTASARTAVQVRRWSFPAAVTSGEAMTSSTPARVAAAEDDVAGAGSAKSLGVCTPSAQNRLLTTLAGEPRLRRQIRRAESGQTAVHFRRRTQLTVVYIVNTMKTTVPSPATTISA